MNSDLIKIVFFVLTLFIANSSFADSVDDLFKEAFLIYKERTPEAKEKAFPIFKKAALKGHVKASGLIGSMLLNGDGIKKDEKEGVYWLHKAADGNETIALLSLAMAYGRGAAGKEPNPYMVLSLLQKAEALGDNRAAEFIRENNIPRVLPVFQSNYFVNGKANSEFNEKIIYIEGVIKNIEYNDKGQPLVEVSIPRYNIDSFWIASQTKFNKQDFQVGHTVRVAGHLAPDSEKEPITKKGRYMLGLCLFSMNSQYGSFFTIAESTCNNWMKGI